MSDSARWTSKERNLWDVRAKLEKNKSNMTKHKNQKVESKPNNIKGYWNQ